MKWWHLTALAGTALLPGPEPGPASPHLLPAAHLANLVANFIMSFSKKFSRERDEIQPLSSSIRLQSPQQC